MRNTTIAGLVLVCFLTVLGGISQLFCSEEFLPFLVPPTSCCRQRIPKTIRNVIVSPKTTSKRNAHLATHSNPEKCDLSKKTAQKQKTPNKPKILLAGHAHRSCSLECLHCPQFLLLPILILYKKTKQKTLQKQKTNLGHACTLQMQSRESALSRFLTSTYSHSAQSSPAPSPLFCLRSSDL